MNRKQLEAPFTPAQIKHRKGNFNRTLAYVEAPVVIARLNDAFDAAWSFEITEHRILQDEVLVLGRLTAEGIVKNQFGSSQITRKKDTGEIISLGDDLKAAATDALKKAATLLGVGLHLYESEASSQKPMNGKGYHANTGFPDKSGPHGYPDNPGYPPNNSHRPPVNGYHDPGHSQGNQHQTHTPVNGQPQGYQQDPRNNQQNAPGHPTDQNIQTPKRLSSKQYQYLKQLASDRAMSSQELAQLTTHKFGCTLDFLSSRQASELITELQQDKTAA
jgi:hypothetical protein